MLPLLLVACVLPKGGTDAPDTASTVDTEMLEAWAGRLPACDGLTSPWPIASADDVGAAWGSAMPNFGDPLVLASNFDFLAQASGCPSRTEDGSTITLSGDCEAEGSRFAGSLVWEDGWEFRYDALDAYDATNDYALVAEGSWWFVSVDEDHAYGADDLTYTDAGAGTYGGTHHLVGYDYLYEGLTNHETLSGRLYVENALGSGDFCISEDLAPSTCPGHEYDEPYGPYSDGWIDIAGSSRWSTRYRGSTTCDGCADVLVDGVYTETLCGDW